MALPAKIWATDTVDRRGRVRRRLQLQVAGATSHGALDAVIRNLSENGMLLETAADLTLGEQLTVWLPGSATLAAIVMWSRPPFFGCEFSVSVTKGVMSEALLGSVPEVLHGNVDDTSWPADASNNDKGRAAKLDRGTLWVMSISLALLLWVLMVFITIVMPVPVR